MIAYFPLNYDTPVLPEYFLSLRKALVCQKFKMSRDLDHAHLGALCCHKANTPRANPRTKFDDSIISHSTEI